ncbi:MAG: hemerythrin domain-containing protein [Planctomycetales bacterium]|nr:hemerythrin domain-containing protein [Planctomycetales bacterium]
MTRFPGHSLLELMDLHEGLQREFAAHQEHLVGPELKPARETWARFERALRHHIREEEEVILPFYEQRAGEVPKGRPEFFRLEHRKIGEFLDRIGPALGALREESPRLRREVLDLLLVEVRFQNLLEHHDQRERTILYPTIERLATPEERTDLFSSLEALAREAG